MLDTTETRSSKYSNTFEFTETEAACLHIIFTGLPQMDSSNEQRGHMTPSLT